MKWRWGVICCGAIVLCIAWRWPTLHLNDFMRASFGHLQYSDTVKFYAQRALSAHRLPYVEQPFEYPVLTGLAIWLAAWAPSIEGYFLATSALLVGCFLGCFLLLAFLLFSRDYSPQYDFWLLPLLAILACPLWLWLVFVVLDAAYYAAIFWYYYLVLGGHLFFPAPNRDIMLGTTVWGRETALVLLTSWALIRLSRTRAHAGSASGAQ